MSRCGEKFEPGDHQDGISRGIPGWQFVVANLNRRRAFFQDRVSLREIFHRIRIRTKIKEVRPLEINAQNRPVVKKKRENEAENTCCYLKRKSTGTRCQRRRNRFCWAAVLQFIRWLSFPELGPKPNTQVYHCRSTPLIDSLPPWPTEYLMSL